jgi:hypothetical protein
MRCVYDYVIYIHIHNGTCESTANTVSGALVNTLMIAPVWESWLMWEKRPLRLRGQLPAAAAGIETSSFVLTISSSYLVDPASSHMLVLKIKPCMSKYKHVVL